MNNEYGRGRDRRPKSEVMEKCWTVTNPSGFKRYVLYAPGADACYKLCKPNSVCPRFVTKCIIIYLLCSINSMCYLCARVIMWDEYEPLLIKSLCSSCQKAMYKAISIRSIKLLQYTA